MGIIFPCSGLFVVRELSVSFYTATVTDVSVRVTGR